MSAVRQLQAALLRQMLQDSPADESTGDVVRGRLQTYRYAYGARLVAALRDNFGALPLVMGDQAFESLAHAYARACPSRDPSIRWFGDRLAPFMEQRRDLVPHPALVDLARLEWAMRGAFDAADATPLDPAGLAELATDAWADLEFVPLPSVQVVALQWKVGPVWQAVQQCGGTDVPELPEPLAQEHAVLVWRRGLEVHWRSLEGPAAELLQGALAGWRFASLCELAAEQVGIETAAQHAALSLQGWLQDGLFSAWHTPGRCAA